MGVALSELVAPLIVAAVMLLALAITGGVVLRRRRRTGGAPPGPQPRPAASSRPPTPGARRRLDRGPDLGRRPELVRVRPLPAASRQRYVAAWSGLQSRVVDRPALALGEADTVVERLLRERGFPVDDPRRAVDVLPAEHARVLDSYRAGHVLEQQNTSTRSDAEQVAQGLEHFRDAFEALVAESPAPYPSAPRERPAERRREPGRS